MDFKGSLPPTGSPHVHGNLICCLPLFLVCRSGHCLCKTSEQQSFKISCSWRVFGTGLQGVEEQTGVTLHPQQWEWPANKSDWWLIGVQSRANTQNLQSICHKNLIWKDRTLEKKQNPFPQGLISTFLQNTYNWTLLAKPMASSFSKLLDHCFLQCSMFMPTRSIWTWRSQHSSKKTSIQTHTLDLCARHMTWLNVGPHIGQANATLRGEKLRVASWCTKRATSQNCRTRGGPVDCRSICLKLCESKWVDFCGSIQQACWRWLP